MRWRPPRPPKEADLFWCCTIALATGGAIGLAIMFALLFAR